MFVKLETLAQPSPEDLVATSSRGGDPRVGTFAGNYRLVARLGEGGMAAVYRAEHRDISGAVVAVKILDRRLAATSGMGRRFLREAQALFELMGRNRHIPRVLDYGKTGHGESYMVMEYLRGLDLAQVLQREGPLPWQRVARLALQLCDALAAAHAREILHRDIKPANCFLVKEDGGEVVKLIDFGVAKDLRVVADPTAVGMIVGTPAYLAPEILIDGAPPSVRSDIYSLAATLYRLLTNTPHVAGQTWQDIAYQLQRAQILPPSTHLGLPGSLPREVDALILRALSRDPRQRFASVLDFAEAVRRCLPRAPDDRARGAASRLRQILALGVTPLVVTGVLAVAEPSVAEPADDVAEQSEVPGDAPAITQTPSDPPEPVTGIRPSPPTGSAAGGEPRATRLDPEQRRRALRRDLGSVGRTVQLCATRHGGNLVTELAVRVQVSAAGVAEHVTLPEPSSAALLACARRAIQSRRYAPGPATDTLRHIFRFRQG